MKMSSEIELLELDSVPIASVAADITMDQMAQFFDSAYGRVVEAVTSQGRTLTGPALALYRRPPSDTVELEAGFPTDQPIDPVGDVLASSLPAGRAVRLSHHGGYDGLADAWGRLITWVLENGYAPTGTSWEVYVTEPTPTMDPDELLTELYCQVL